MAKKAVTQPLAEGSGKADGDVYMDPDTYLLGNEDLDFLDDRKDEQKEKLPSFKAKLFLSHDPERSIGDFNPELDKLEKPTPRVACRIHMDYLKYGTSSLRVEIKAIIVKPSPITGPSRSEEVVHVWTFKLNSQSAIKTPPVIHMFTPGFTTQPTAVENEIDELFMAVAKDDKHIQKFRQQKHLGYLRFDFTPSQLHTEGILQDIDGLKNFQYIQDDLLKVFGRASDKPVQIEVFLLVSNSDAFVTSYGTLKNAWKEESVIAPWCLWFNGLPDAKCKVQKGQITPRDKRPLHQILPFEKSFPSSEYLWLVIGVSIIIKEELDIDNAQTSYGVECQLRVMVTTAGGDRVYMGLLRLPDTYVHRFSTEDSFLVEIGEEQWTATILPNPFPFASSMDYSIQLNRPFDRETGEWSTFELKPVLDLATSGGKQQLEIENQCVLGHYINVRVLPVLSDIPAKFKLAAVRKLNPAHVGDKNHVSNVRWQRILLGQDLRTVHKATVFGGINIKACLQEWDIDLTESQLAGLYYIGSAPNSLGLVKGPWGTGKTKLDIVVTLLLMSVGKKVKVLSSTNKAADTFTEKLKTEIARIEAKIGRPLTENYVVRFHSPATETTVVQVDSAKYRDPPPVASHRWRPDAQVQASVYDKIAADIIESSMSKTKPVPDRRYKLQHASFGTLLLQLTGVLDRPKPEKDDPEPAGDHPLPPHPPVDPSSKEYQDGLYAGDDKDKPLAGQEVYVPTSPEPEKDDQNSPEGYLPAPHLQPDTQSEGTPHPSSDSADKDEPSEDQNKQAITDESFDSDEEGGKGAEPKPSSREAELLRLVHESSELRMANAVGETKFEKLCQCFREMFAQAENGDLDDMESQARFNWFHKRVSEEIMTNNVAVLVTTLVNSANSIVKENFRSNHTIVQEAGKADDGEALIALADCADDDQSAHFSGDVHQLGPPEEDPRVHIFARFVNCPLFKRLISLGYPTHELCQQHRSIPLINDIISKIWYKDTVRSTVNPEDRPNVGIACQVHSDLFKRNTPVIWVNRNGTSKKMGHSYSSQNTDEIQVAIKLCQEYIQHGVPAGQIVILAGYVAQVQLTKRNLAVTEGLQNVECGTIDGYQGEEKSIAILNIVGSEKLGFMSSPPRLLTGVSRAADALAIITNSDRLETSTQKRKIHLYQNLRRSIGKKGYACYSDKLPDLPILIGDEEKAPKPRAHQDSSEEGLENAEDNPEDFDMDAEEDAPTTADEAAAQNEDDDWTNAKTNSWEKGGPAKKDADLNTWGAVNEPAKEDADFNIFGALDDNWPETTFPDKTVDGGATETQEGLDTPSKDKGSESPADDKASTSGVSTHEIGGNATATTQEVAPKSTGNPDDQVDDATHQVHAADTDQTSESKKDLDATNKDEGLEYSAGDNPSPSGGSTLENDNHAATTSHDAAPKSTAIIDHHVANTTNQIFPADTNQTSVQGADMDESDGGEVRVSETH